MICSLLVYYLSVSTLHSITVSAQTISFNQPATGPSNACEGSDVTLQCVIEFISSSSVTTDQDSIWTRNGTLAATIPNHRLVRNSTTGRITNLMITNVTLADDNAVYTCTDSGVAITSSVLLNVTGGPPDDITDITIPSDTVTTCSFAVKWSRPSSDPLSYTVTISSEGVMIMTNNTKMTNYFVTGLKNNTEYDVNVTANNVCGSSNTATMKTMTKGGGTNIGLPSSPTNIIIALLNSTSIIVNWTRSDPSYTYIVMWTALNSDVMVHSEVLQNTNNYIITGLNDNNKYTLSVSIITTDVCGIIITSDPRTFNRTINKPTLSTSSSFQTIPIPTDSNVTDNALSDSDENNATTIIIAVVVSIAAIMIIIIATLFVSVLAWRYYQKNKGSIKQSELSEENNYAQAGRNMNGNNSQEKPNEEYAYARNGPRHIKFPSEMPQQQ